MNHEPTTSRSGFRKGLRIALVTLIAVPFLYLLGAVIGAFVPHNASWQEPSEGIVIFVRDNGVHVDLVLPASAAGVDLYRLVPPSHIADPEAADGWVAFGWGQREFYLETPRWSDLTVENAARSVFGGQALMHVEHVAPPHASSDTRPITLDRQAYGQLAAAVVDGFVIDAGQAVPLLGRGYGSDDVFYEATGRYDAFRTSNQWTAGALAEAGVKVGVWTPFAQGIMWRFRLPEA